MQLFHEKPVMCGTRAPGNTKASRVIQQRVRTPGVNGRCTGHVVGLTQEQRIKLTQDGRLRG